MAINFPANPQDGDTYNGFRYEAANNAWFIDSSANATVDYVNNKETTINNRTDNIIVDLIDNANAGYRTLGTIENSVKSLINVKVDTDWATDTSILPAGSINVEHGSGTSKIKVGTGAAAWSDLEYVIDDPALQAYVESQITPIQSSLSSKASTSSVQLKADLDSPVFTGSVTLPSTTSIGNVTNDEIATLDGVTSSIQSQLDGKLSQSVAATTYASLDSPVFVNSVILPADTTIDGISPNELAALNGIQYATGTIQEQLDDKAPINSPTFTGTVAGITKSMVGLGNVNNTSDVNKPVSDATQIALDAKASLSGATFTGDISAPNLTLSGDLFVGGTTTTVNTSNTAVSDNMIYLNEAITYTVTNAVGNGAAVTYTIGAHDLTIGMVARVTGITPSGLNVSSYQDILAVTSTTITLANTDTSTYTSGGSLRSKSAVNPDLGISGGYNDGTYRHSGIFRDASDSGRWKLFEGYTPEPNGLTIDTTDSSFALADLQVDNVKATGITFADGTTQTKAGVPSASSFISKTASYTLDSSSLVDNIIEVNSSSATTITIPLDATINFPVGSSIDIIQTGTGTVSIDKISGVTLNATPGLKLRTQWSSATILKRAANTWIAYGDLTA